MPCEPTPPHSPRDLRRRILRLRGLPLRPATARGVLDGASSGQSPDPAEARLVDLDPGWIVARWRADGADARTILAEQDWWPPATGAAHVARETLWRHSAAIARAAVRLAAERGASEPATTGRLGMLLDLGYWALACVAPERLAEALAIDDPARRRSFERSILGTDLATLGRDLADRWDLPAPLAEAIWLASMAEGGRVDLWESSASEGLALLRKAHAWAERTPWALHPKPPESSVPDPRLRLLVAEVQVRCAGPLASPDASPREMHLTRAHARLLLDASRREGEEADWSRFLEAVSRWLPGDDLDDLETAPEAARAAWRRVVDDRDRLAGRLEALSEAHHRLSVADGVARATERLDALAEFAAGAAHELNNPLAVILGRAQLLLPKADDEVTARSLRAIIAQAQRAHRILRDLIYIARPPEPRPRPCAVGDLLRAAVRDLVEEAAARGVRLESELGEAPSGPVPLDPDPLRHAVDVLVRNAIEATPAGGTVRVRARSRAGGVELSVCDDGPGLDPRAAKHLLDPFFCGRQAGRGLGLGLPRVARWLARADGSLRWSAAPGGGTTFHLTLPTAETTTCTPTDGNGSVGGPRVPRVRDGMPPVQAIS